MEKIAFGAAGRGRRVNHVCRVFDDPAMFREHTAAFLTAGVAAGHRLEYLASGTLEEIRRFLDGSAALGTLLDTGQLAVRSLDAQYGVDEVVDPEAPVAAYAAATQDALAQGYTGLRVVADATTLVRTPAQREAFARYEHLVDRYMVDHPFFALCGYDLCELGHAAAEEIACLHPLSERSPTAGSHFQWSASTDADIDLRGEVDLTTHDLFDLTLARTLPLVAGARTEVDARDLEFIDHRGLLTLERHARQADTEIALRTGSAVVRRLVDLLDLTAVRPE